MNRYRNYGKFRAREYISVFMLFFPFFIIFSIISSAIYISTTQTRKEYLVNSSIQAVIEIEKKINQAIQETYELSYNFLANDYIMQLVPKPQHSNAEESLNAILLVKNLEYFRNSLSSDVYHVNLFSEHSSLFNDSGRYEINQYFDVLNPHDNGDSGFWKEIAREGTPLLLLPADVVNEKYNFREKRIIVPLTVSRKIGDTRWLLVVEIQGSYFHRILETEKLLEGQMALCFDNGGNIIVNTTSYNFTSDELQTLIGVSNSKPFYTDDNYVIHGEQNYLMMTRCVEGVQVALLTPRSVINAAVKADRNNQIMLSVFVVAMILFFILTIICSQRLYKPIKSIIQFINEVQANSGIRISRNGIYGMQLNKVNEMYKKKDKMLYDNLNKAINAIICNAGKYKISDIENSFKELSSINALSFGCMAIRIEFIDAYYETFNDEEQEIIEAGLPLILSCTMSADLNCYVTEFIQDYFICIFQQDSNDNIIQQSITSIMHSFDTLFQYDKQYCTIFYGLSQKYNKDFLFDCIMEAITALEAAPRLNRSLVVFDPSEVSYRPTFNLRERNTLLSYIQNGDKEKAIAYVERLLNENMSNYLYEPLLQKIVSLMYDSCNEYLQNSLNTLDKDGREEVMRLISQEISYFPHSTMLIKLKHYIETAIDLVKPSEAYNVNLDRVFEFIKNNYCNALYLEIISEHVSMNPKYLSRCFKEKMGLGISEYINYVRINKAKEMLVDTDESIADIGNAVGFDNRTTFFRSFKRLAGISPNDFRKTYKG